MPRRGRNGRRLPSPALVVSAIALCVALSGTAVALSAGSIGSREIANGSLRSGDLRDGKAVTGADVVEDSLTGSQIDEATLELDQEVPGYEIVEASGEFAAGFFHTATARCPDGKRALGGGYRLSDSAGTGWNASIVAVPFESRPVFGGSAWEVE
ncbi:MAG: hypothetical protein M3Y34_09450, partial [Actinomycetota bacterium]|nr:hypothetical protein [Actinomycetota bacterium]